MRSRRELSSHSTRVPYSCEAATYRTRALQRVRNEHGFVRVERRLHTSPCDFSLYLLCYDARLDRKLNDKFEMR